MLLRMVKCDNPTSVGNKYVGVVGEFTYKGSIFYFGNMYSSTVRSIIREGDKITVQTKNTEYVFEVENNG